MEIFEKENDVPANGDDFSESTNKTTRTTPMSCSTWLRGTRRHAPHFSQKTRAFLPLPFFPLSLSLPLFLSFPLSTPSHRLFLTPFRHPSPTLSLSISIRISISISLFALIVAFHSNRNLQFLFSLPFPVSCARCSLIVFIQDLYEFFRTIFCCTFPSCSQW